MWLVVLSLLQLLFLVLALCFLAASTSEAQLIGVRKAQDGKESVNDHSLRSPARIKRLHIIGLVFIVLHAACMTADILLSFLGSCKVDALLSLLGGFSTLPHPWTDCSFIFMFGLVLALCPHIGVGTQDECSLIMCFSLRLFFECPAHQGPSPFSSVL